MRALKRSLRSQLAVWLLLLAQVTSLMIVPLHAVAHAKHAKATHRQGAQAAAVAADTGFSTSRPANFFASLFGHELGSGCDDWSAAFSLDAHPGHAFAVVPLVHPASSEATCFEPAAPHTAAPGAFLARAPPRN